MLTCFTLLPKDEKQKKCMDCGQWRGCCGRGVKNRIAADPACVDFEQKMEFQHVKQGEL